jgi:hypothetical protein
LQELEYRLIGLDAAETAGFDVLVTRLTFREQSCRAMICRWDGGTPGRVD